MGRTDGDAFTNKLNLSGQARLAVPPQMLREYLHLLHSQPHKFSEGQHNPIIRDFINQTYFCKYTGLFIIPSGISELDCATTKTDTAERSISIGRESLQVFFSFVLGALAYLQVPPLGGSPDEKWRSQ